MTDPLSSGDLSAEPIRILHVDDESDFTDLAAEFLERESDRFRVETATSVAAGLDRLAAADFDCVVSDYDMPDRTGIEFLEAVRADHPNLPFVLYTGKGSEEVASEAISAGVTDYLQKERGTEQYELLANRITNVVEAYRSRRMLVERTRRLETLISNLPGMVYRCRNEPDWPMETVAGEVEALTGYPADAIQSNEVAWGEEIIHPDDQQTVWETVQDALSADGTFEVTYRIVTDAGATKWVWERGRGVYAGDGDLVALEGFITDVTDRRAHERELEEKNALLSTLFETLPVGVLAEDASRNVLAISHRTFELFELDGTPESVVGMDCERMAEEVSGLFVDPDGFVERIDDLVRERTPVRNEALELRDGRVLSRLYEPIEFSDGEGHLWVYRDITDRKEREEELERRTEELAAQYRYLFEEAPVMGVVTRAADGRPIIEDCNRLFAETVGYPKEEIVGRELAEFYAPESRRKLLDEGGYDRALTGEFVREDRVLLTADGEAVETLLRAVPRRNATDATDGTLALYIDVSERKELEREKERLEEFTRVVSHDLRNPLNVAQGQAELAREVCDTDHLDAVVRAHDRMETLIEDLLTLSRSGERIDEVEPVSLASLAETCWLNVEAPVASLVVDVDRTVRADRSRLKQLLENLFRNCVEHGSTGNRAEPGDSVEHSSTSSRAKPDDSVEHGSTGSRAKPDDSVEDDGVTITVGPLGDGFYVEDDGSGIPEAERERVFEAGYSTSEDGTGFGLSIVKQVAEAHGWAIRATEGADGGARFEITDVEFAP